MKIIKIKLINGQIVQMQVSDEQYQSYKEVQRPYWREKKKQLRHGISLDELVGENNADVADNSKNPEVLFDCQANQIHRSLHLKKLKQGLKTLSEKQSNAIYKHFFLEMSFVEIAQEESVNESAIRRRIKAALKKLKKLF